MRILLGKMTEIMNQRAIINEPTAHPGNNVDIW